MPESTTAIVGACGAGADAVPHIFATPDSYGHIWFDELTVPLSFTGASAVIVSPGFFASAFRRAAGMSTATAPIKLRRRCNWPTLAALTAASSTPPVL